MQRFAQLQFDRLNTIPITDRILGTAFLVVVAVSIIATRGIAVLLPLLAGFIVLFALYERASLKIFLDVPAVVAAFGVLLAYALLSTAWSVSPLDSMPHVAIAILMLLSAHGLAAWIGTQDEPLLKHLVFWIIVAFAAGLAWLTFDLMTLQGVKRWFVNEFGNFKPLSRSPHYKIDETGYVWLNLSDLNRNTAALNLLLWPIMMGAAAMWTGVRRNLIIAALFIVTVLATFGSEHETSKLAIIAASLVYVIARLSTKVAKGLLLAGWAVAIVATVPVALYAYNDLQLQNAPWVQPSGRERIVIWADIAERTFTAPVIGSGARSTNTLNALKTASLTQSNDKKEWRIGRHPHNVYLQAWYELGAIGALLLAVAGFVAFSQITHYPAFTQPFAFATLTAMALELALCWDIWQRWFFALLCFAAVILVLVLRWVSLQGQSALPDARS